MQAQVQMRRNIDNMHEAMHDLDGWLGDIGKRDASLRGKAAPASADGSAAATADQQATIPVARPVLEAEPYEGLPGTLHGWLKKRHVRDKSLQKQWARRYFSVDEQRGTLSYSKSEGRRANVILPLCDVTSVRALDIDVYGPFCFVISCPPLQLTVRAADQVRRYHCLSPRGRHGHVHVLALARSPLPRHGRRSSRSG